MVGEEDQSKRVVFDSRPDLCADNEEPGGAAVGGCCAALRAACWRCMGRVYPSGVLAESWQMFALSWPIIVTQICQMIIGPVSLIYCGHLHDRIKLDGAALAISIINATCIAVGQGLGTACDTFFSQTYGSRNKKLVGVYVQRASLIFMLALLPCLAVHLNIESLLLLCRQHPDVAKLAGDYLLLFIPGAISFFIYIVLSKYVQNQNIVIPNMLIGIVCNGVNGVLHYVFLFHLQWDLPGSALSQSLSYFLMCLLTFIYIRVSGVYKDTWGGWSQQCLQEWGKFLRLCVPGMLMLCMEWWGFEIGVFLTGLIGTVELGAQSVLLQIDSIWFQIPLGIQIACAIRVGQYLGCGDIAGAKTSARLALTFIALISMVTVTLFLTLRWQISALFTNVTEVVALTSRLLPIVALYVFFDGVAVACKGVLYGTGRQILGAVVMFVSYYILALPIGIPLMFCTSLSSAAYWWALAANLILQSVVLFIAVSRTDWQRMADEARDRAGMMGESLRENYEGAHCTESEEERPLLLDAASPDQYGSLTPCAGAPSTRSLSAPGPSLVGRLTPNIGPPLAAATPDPTHTDPPILPDLLLPPGQPPIHPTVTKHRRRRLVSASLSPSEIEAVMNESSEMPPSELAARRLSALILMLGILGVGVGMRLVFTPEHILNELYSNNTAQEYSNVTLATPSPHDVTTPLTNTSY